MPPPRDVFLSLGSNLGDRQHNLERALQELSAAGVKVEACSSIYETEPQDVAGQPWFLNMAVQCRTEYFPLHLLAMLHKIERALGRVRKGAAPRGPRLIDLDILLYAGTVMDTGELVIPHPRMLQRRFVLEPLLEIAPALRDPASGMPLRQALARLPPQQTRRLDTQPQCSGQAKRPPSEPG